MHFLDKRVNVICEELKKLKIRQKFTIDNWQYKEGNYIRPQEAEADTAAWEDFDCQKMHWYGKDRHYWFKTTYRVPHELDGKRMWLHVRTQIDEWDDAKNPQFLLFVNGEVVQGIDMNHRDVFLSPSAKEGDVLEIGLQAYTGILHTEFNLIVEMQEIDDRIEKLYYDLWVPLAAFSRMEEDDKNRRDIEEILNRTGNFLDLRTPYSEAFYSTLSEASDYIDKALYSDMAGYQDVIATCIGHTHIDVAWWWTVAQTREKTGRSFATVLKLMEEYPNYKFMSSQPQLYAFLKERYPELYEKAKERIREGRWEPEGGMWVEADCNLTSGESLVRQFMHGKRFFREEFGVDNRILWLPDVFGYSGALPQIMKKCGIDYFMTTKLAWNQFNKIPYDTMRWRGIDGTEVLTHLITTLGVNQPIKDFFTTYNGMLHPDAIMGGWMRYQNKDINNDILISYGYGDGGGGPTREMLETSIRMEKGVKGIPKVRQAFARTYFDELDERVSKNNRLPVWEGELYFEYHRGTLTSMARNKRSNRKSELGLMDLELLSVLTAPDMAYPQEELDAMWKVVLLNQFHDILPGSSIHEVYEVTKEEYGRLAEQLAAMIGERRKAIAGSGSAVTVFNTTGKVRDDIVWFTRYRRQRTEASHLCRICLQRVTSRSQSARRHRQLSGRRSHWLESDSWRHRSTRSVWMSMECSQAFTTRKTTARWYSRDSAQTSCACTRISRSTSTTGTLISIIRKSSGTWTMWSTWSGRRSARCARCLRSRGGRHSRRSIRRSSSTRTAAGSILRRMWTGKSTRHCSKYTSRWRCTRTRRHLTCSSAT